MKIGQAPLKPPKPYELFLQEESKNLKKQDSELTRKEIADLAWRQWKRHLKPFEKDAYVVRADEMQT